ncbi:MAG: ATP-binding cassette domain-containing protein [Anaerolineales bacterium]|nr:ATP-binding cassette domain-containing protein [Anaerolineales bacterium]
MLTARKNHHPGFTTTIQRGDKIGIVGANGSGKTTSLKLLMGQLQPQTGEVRHGTNPDIVHFGPTWHNSINPSPCSITSGVDATPSLSTGTRNLMGYLEDFLTRDPCPRADHRTFGRRAQSPLLARLFFMPANLLILDEPTNDPRYRNA